MSFLKVSLSAGCLTMESHIAHGISPHCSYRALNISTNKTKVSFPKHKSCWPFRKSVYTHCISASQSQGVQGATEPREKKKEQPLKGCFCPQKASKINKQHGMGLIQSHSNRWKASSCPQKAHSKAGHATRAPRAAPPTHQPPAVILHHHILQLLLPVLGSSLLGLSRHFAIISYSSHPKFLLY